MRSIPLLLTLVSSVALGACSKKQEPTKQEPVAQSERALSAPAPIEPAEEPKPNTGVDPVPEDDDDTSGATDPAEDDPPQVQHEDDDDEDIEDLAAE